MKIKLTLPAPVFSFLPPLHGFDGLFNTIRMGKRWSTRVKHGDVAILMDPKAFTAFGIAQVVGVKVDHLYPLCVEHGYLNHSQIGLPTAGAPQRVFDLLQSIYGPHIAKADKWGTMVLLQRIALT